MFQRKDKRRFYGVYSLNKDHNDYVNGAGFCCEDKDKKLQAYGSGIGKGNEEYEKMQYYYHADHLGSSSYITNLDAQIVQHVEYVPFGEVFIEERNQSWNTPYLFNGKELDEETGLYYYGARYYNPRESIFLSVDPLAELYPNVSPYAYAFLNPVNYIDPTGMAPADPPEKELPEVTVTGAKDTWVKGAGIWNNIFKHSNRIRAEQYNKKNLGGAGTVKKVGRGKFTVEASVTIDLQSVNGPFNVATDLNISARFGANSDDPNLDFSISQRTVSTDGPLMYTGFGYDPGLSDAIGAYVGKQIEEGNITGGQAVLLGVGGTVLSKGKSGGAIKGFTKHAVNRAIERGFSASNILKIVKEGEAVKAVGRYGVQMRYTLGGNTVIVNGQGKVVTVFSSAVGSKNGLGKGHFIPID